MDSTKAAQELFRYLIVLFRGPAEGIREVSKGEMAVLAFLSFQTTPVNPTVLSDKFNLSTARIANTLNGLEKKQFIERSHDTADRRKVTVSLTRKGSDFAKAKYDENIDGLRQLLEALGEKDTEEFLRICARIDILARAFIERDHPHKDAGTTVLAKTSGGNKNEC